MLRSFAIAVALLLGTTAGAACGGDDQGPEAQPDPDASRFVEGDFDDLPRYPRSEPFGPKSEKRGIITQSFRATGATPDAVIEYFRTAMQQRGWEPAEPVFRDDTASRVDFVTDEHRLEVSAVVADANDSESTDNAAVQYSLVLRPRS